MIERLVNTAFSRRGVVWLVFFFAALYGVFSWKQLPLEAYPDIADVTSQIVTQVPGLAAEEIEQQITIPLERALLATPGMHVLRSRSLFALSLITVLISTVAISRPPSVSKWPMPSAIASPRPSITKRAVKALPASSLLPM